MTGVSGCIIAGGRARRMGGKAKGLLLLGGQTITGRVIERLSAQVSELAINANDGQHAYEQFGFPIVADPVAGQPGPLAGLLAALEWSKANWIATVPSDTPFIPRDLVSRLRSAAEGHTFAIAQSGGRGHFICGLWKKSLAVELRKDLEKGVRRAEDWISRRKHGVATWEPTPYDPFFNINSPEELIEAERIVKEFQP